MPAASEPTGESQATCHAMTDLTQSRAGPSASRGSSMNQTWTIAGGPSHVLATQLRRRVPYQDATVRTHADSSSFARASGRAVRIYRVETSVCDWRAAALWPPDTCRQTACSRSPQKCESHAPPEEGPCSATATRLRCRTGNSPTSVLARVPNQPDNPSLRHYVQSLWQATPHEFVMSHT